MIEDFSSIQWSINLGCSDTNRATGGRRASERLGSRKSRAADRIRSAAAAPRRSGFVSPTFFWGSWHHGSLGSNRDVGRSKRATLDTKAAP